MRIKETQVFQFDELSDDAKERARDWYRRGMAYDYYDSEYLVDEFVTILHACGFVPETARNSKRPAVYWSTNPTGAAFSASWSSARSDSAASIAARAAIVADRSTDEVLPGIFGRLANLCADYPECYGLAIAGGRDGLTQRSDVDTVNGDCDAEANAGSEFETVVSDLAHWFACQADADEQWRYSDECVDDNIRANEYEFDAEGDLAC